MNDPSQRQNCQSEMGEAVGPPSDALRRSLTLPKRLASISDVRVEAAKLYRLGKAGVLDARTVAASVQVLRLVLQCIEQGELLDRVEALENELRPRRSE